MKTRQQKIVKRHAPVVIIALLITIVYVYGAVFRKGLFQALGLYLLMVWATIYRLRVQRESRTKVRRILISVDCLLLFVGLFLIIFTLLICKNSLECVIGLLLLSIGFMHVAIADLYTQKFKKKFKR